MKMILILPFTLGQGATLSAINHQPSTSDAAQSTPSWESGANFELNDADDVVLNMLLTQTSMDSLFDSSTWLETDSFLEYLNMNPDLTSD